MKTAIRPRDATCAVASDIHKPTRLATSFAHHWSAYPSLWRPGRCNVARLSPKPPHRLSGHQGPARRACKQDHKTLPLSKPGILLQVLRSCCDPLLGPQQNANKVANRCKLTIIPPATKNGCRTGSRSAAAAGPSRRRWSENLEAAMNGVSRHRTPEVRSISLLGASQMMQQHPA